MIFIKYLEFLNYLLSKSDGVQLKVKVTMFN